MRQGSLWAIAALVSVSAPAARAQQNPPPPAASQQPVKRITLDEALQMALQRNHALLALRTTILQNQAQEITANLRPNPTLTLDTQYFPLFQPNQLSGDYINNSEEFDAGIAYLFERGKKRQHRLQAAKDATAVTRSQVTDGERQLSFNVAQQFVSVLLAQSTIDLAKEDLGSFKQTVDISESRYKIGDMSEADLLKIKLQLLQFQMDASQAELSKVQALTGLRQFIGFESVPEQYDVEGQLDYEPIRLGLDDLKALALRTRPDLIAARQGITAARSQESLAEANGKKDITGTFNYSHSGGVNSAAIYAAMDLPFFDRNQGEIARTRYAITQAEEQANEASEQAISDVVDAYEGLRTNDQIIKLYRGGYIDQNKQSRDITEYAYKRGAASLLDLLDAERTYRANELAYRQSLANYMTALEQLREAVGTRTLP
jgi:cobalt-zinc-cadmium efflux system outer membrane protein